MVRWWLPEPELSPDAIGLLRDTVDRLGYCEAAGAEDCAFALEQVALGVGDAGLKVALEAVTGIRAVVADCADPHKWASRVAGDDACTDAFVDALADEHAALGQQLDLVVHLLLRCGGGTERDVVASVA